MSVESRVSGRRSPKTTASEIQRLRRSASSTFAGAMFFPLDYYGSNGRGAVPAWTNRFAVMSWSDWLTFDAVSAAKGVSVPTLMVHADEAALPSLLEAYIRDLLARAMGTSPARIDSQQSLRNLGLDSLIAVEVRNRINAELGMNVPLAKFMQGDSSINALAVYAAERLTETNRGEQGKTSGHSSGNGMMPAAEPSPPLSGADAADLLERIDELSEEELDRAPDIRR